MKKLLILACASALLGGCATRPAMIDNDVSSAMLNANIVLVYHPTPDFRAVRVGKELWGAYGQASMAWAGGNIVAWNQIGDPAHAIGKELIKELTTSRGARLARAPFILETRNPRAIGQAVKESGAYALAVETQEWDLHYFADFTHYQVKFVLRARLLETASGKILAEGSCEYVPDRKAQDPTYIELVGAGAAGLKSELAKASAQCLGNLKHGFLNL